MQLKIPSETLKQLLNVFEQVKYEIKLLDSNTGHEVEQNTFDTQYFQNLKTVEQYTETHNLKHKISSSNASISATNANESVSNKVRIKLPLIDIPKFYGALH